jgi:hypothetical protein
MAYCLRTLHDRRPCRTTPRFARPRAEDGLLPAGIGRHPSGGQAWERAHLSRARVGAARAAAQNASSVALRETRNSLYESAEAAEVPMAPHASDSAEGTRGETLAGGGLLAIRGAPELQLAPRGEEQHDDCRGEQGSVMRWRRPKSPPVACSGCAEARLGTRTRLAAVASLLMLPPLDDVPSRGRAIGGRGAPEVCHKSAGERGRALRLRAGHPRAIRRAFAPRERRSRPRCRER